MTALPEKVVLERDLPCPGPTISANANHIHQVLTNLLTNAWKAMANPQAGFNLNVESYLYSLGI